MLDLIASFAIGYFLGAFPSASVVARLFGKDIFRTGSGNMGAMNAARNVSWAAGAAVLVLDVGKGAAAVVAAAALGDLGSAAAGTRLAMPFVAGVGAICGHAWSVFARFRGGKALATTLGVSLPLYPLAGVYSLLLMIALMLLTRRSHLSAVLTVVLFPVVVALVLNRAGVHPDVWFTAITTSVLMALVVLYKHWRPSRPRLPEPE